MLKDEARIDTERQINELKNNLRKTTTEYARGTMRESTRKARRWLLLSSFITLLWCFNIELKKIAPAGFEIGGNVQGLIPIALVGMTAYFLSLFIVYNKNDFSYFGYLRNDILINMADINRTLNEMGYDPKKFSNPNSLPFGPKLDKETESYCRYQADYLKKIGDYLEPVRLTNNRRILIDYYFPIILAGGAILVFIIRYFFNWFQGPPVC